MLHPPAETTPSLPECRGAASGCLLLPGLPYLGLDHRAAWVEAEADGHHHIDGQQGRRRPHQPPRYRHSGDAACRLTQRWVNSKEVGNSARSPVCGPGRSTSGGDGCRALPLRLMAGTLTANTLDDTDRPAPGLLNRPPPDRDCDATCSRGPGKIAYASKFASSGRRQASGSTPRTAARAF